MIASRQLLGAGLSRDAIRHRIRRGKLHPVRRGIYAVGRPEIGQRGFWMAAVLAAGPGAHLSHRSAAALWGITSTPSRSRIELTIPARRASKLPGIRGYRRDLLPNEVTRRENIPLTSPALTLVDLAAEFGERQLEAAINAADKLDLVDSERLRVEIAAMPRRRGLTKLRELLERHALQLTDSELERIFLRLIREAGLTLPLTQQWVNGHRVDFLWPAQKLIVETDGLRYHRTPLEQARDSRRDQAHAAAGLTSLRFTHHEIAHEPQRVVATLALVLRHAA